MELEKKKKKKELYRGGFDTVLVRNLAVCVCVYVCECVYHVQGLY